MAGGEVELVGLSKTFDNVTAVGRLDLKIAAGEFFSLLGPSGCGKSTTLRLIAGFERPTSGQVLIDGVDMSNVPPHLRPVNTVFQSYALFPHLSVGENVAFGLKYQDTSRDRTASQVGEALEMVRLGGFEKRKPHQLSGGQQQRVALARSLVLNPSVLLLDEPLGALDAKLRKALQIELKSLQEDVGVTFIYVTHDQEEALTMSDRLAVMSAGRVEQVGTPAQVYEQPQRLCGRLPRLLQSYPRHHRGSAFVGRLPGGDRWSSTHCDLWRHRGEGAGPGFDPARAGRDRQRSGQQLPEFSTGWCTWAPCCQC